MTLNPKYENLRHFIEEIPAKFDVLGEEIYHKRNIVKRMVAPDGTVLNVKRYCVPYIINRMVYSYGIRKPKGVRAYANPLLLKKHGVDSPESVAYMEERNWLGLIGHSFYISIQSPYRHTMYELLDYTLEKAVDLMDAFVAFTVKMHKSEVFHRDYSPGNILWDKVDGEYKFSLVDTNRMYYGPVSVEMGLKGFRRLWATKDIYIYIVRRYAALCGYDEDAGEQMALEERKKFWTRFGLKHPLPFPVEF